MTAPPVDELMRIVRHSLRVYEGHPEYDDLYSEGLIHAWQVVTRPGAEWRSWSTIAYNAARWQALEYLRSRRSGLLDWRRDGDRERPIALSRLTYRDDDETDDRVHDLLPTDGGIDAADARLQGAILWRRVAAHLTHRERRALLLVVGQGLSLREAETRMGLSDFTVAAALQTAIQTCRQVLGIEAAPLSADAQRTTALQGARLCGHCRQPVPAPPRTGRHSGRGRRYCSARCKWRALDDQRRADRQGLPRAARICRFCQQPIPATRGKSSLFCSGSCKDKEFYRRKQASRPLEPAR